MNHVSVYVGYMKLFVIVNNDGIKINVDANVKNELKKECVIKDLFGIRVTKLVNITVENENNSRCNSYVVYKVLFLIFFIIIIVIQIYFVYHKYVNRIKFDLPY